MTKKVYEGLAIEFITIANEDILTKSVGWDAEGWDEILDGYNGIGG